MHVLRGLHQRVVTHAGQFPNIYRHGLSRIRTLAPRLFRVPQLSGPKLEPQQGTPSEAPTASAAAGLTLASQPKSSMDADTFLSRSFMSAASPKFDFLIWGCGRRFSNCPALAR